ncbi:hypothetical protein NL676_032303 [Syzygium grande]|nr:hypothetical protein NL676_032303 [Syzygium grande]
MSGEDPCDDIDYLDRIRFFVSRKHHISITKDYGYRIEAFKASPRFSSVSRTPCQSHAPKENPPRSTHFRSLVASPQKKTEDTPPFPFPHAIPRSLRVARSTSRLGAREPLLKNVLAHDSRYDSHSRFELDSSSSVAGTDSVGDSGSSFPPPQICIVVINAGFRGLRSDGSVPVLDDDCCAGRVSFL